MRKSASVLAILAMVTFVAAPALAGDAPDGKALYGSKCAMCHGADGVAKAMAKGSASFNAPEFQKAASLETIEKVIVEGKGKMPKFSEKLKPEEVKAVATFVKTLGGEKK